MRLLKDFRQDEFDPHGMSAAYEAGSIVTEREFQLRHIWGGAKDQADIAKRRRDDTLGESEAREKTCYEELRREAAQVPVSELPYVIVNTEGSFADLCKKRHRRVIGPCQVMGCYWKAAAVVARSPKTGELTAYHIPVDSHYVVFTVAEYRALLSDIRAKRRQLKQQHAAYLVREQEWRKALGKRRRPATKRKVYEANPEALATAVQTGALSVTVDGKELTPEQARAHFANLRKRALVAA